MANMPEPNASSSAPITDSSSESPYTVADDVHGLRTLFVNVFFVGQPGVGNPWVLVDAGLPGYAGPIKKRAAELFGSGNKPRAVVLTHGHFDHTGALKSLLKDWDVPVYAHPLEEPYLTGKSGYPPPDPTIGTGLITLTSFALPIGPSDFSDNLKLVADGESIPELPGWRVVHTPGHAPGHISLFRDGDRTLLAGDAFMTTDMDSVVAVAQQKQEFHGPPIFITCDWGAAEQSVKLLAALKPTAAGVGHGVSVRGADLERGLNQLTHHFAAISIPSEGRYVKQPAVTDENGIVSMPAPVSYNAGRAIGLGLLAGLLLWACWPSGSNSDD